MSNEEIKKHFLDYMNTECVDDPPIVEPIVAGEAMQDPDNIAYLEKLSSAYGLARELLASDDEALWWDDDARRWSIKSAEE